MSASSRRRTITLPDGARVILRPIAPDDAPLIAAGFDRLSEESRFRRFFTLDETLSPAQLTYLVDVDHHDHEAIIAVDPSNEEVLGIARYVRLTAGGEIAEVAVSVADDWQRRGLGRSLLERLAYRARREGVRKFSALVMSGNRGAVKLLTNLGDTQRRDDTGEVELIIDLPAQRGMGAQLARALRAAAAGSVVPANTRAIGAGPSPRTPLQPQRPIRTIVVGADGSATGEKAVAVALRLGGILGAVLHVVSAYRVFRASSDAEAVLDAAMQSASAHGLQAVTHTRHDDPADALITVAQEQDADLIVVGDMGMSGTSRFLLGSVPHKVSHDAPCSVLIVRTS